MTEEYRGNIDNGALREALEERRQLLAYHFSSESEMVEQALSERSQQVKWWEDTITRTRKDSWAQQLSSYHSLAGSLAGLLGASVKEQAKVMVPFEVAEATKEFARFIGSKDPSALASSLKHTLAAKQYAAVAKAGSAGSASGGRAGGTGGERQDGVASSREEEARSRQARVIVNVGRKVGVVDTYDFARTIIDAINENIRDEVILEVAS